MYFVPSSQHIVTKPEEWTCVERPLLQDGGRYVASPRHWVTGLRFWTNNLVWEFSMRQDYFKGAQRACGRLVVLLLRSTVWTIRLPIRRIKPHWAANFTLSPIYIQRSSRTGTGSPGTHTDSYRS